MKKVILEIEFDKKPTDNIEKLDGKEKGKNFKQKDAKFVLKKRRKNVFFSFHRKRWMERGWHL